MAASFYCSVIYKPSLKKTNYALMKSVHMIYNRGVSASESFVIFDLSDLTKQIKQKGEEMWNQLCSIFNICWILGD